MMVFACRFSGVSVCGGASCASSRAACAAAYHARFTQIDPMPVTQDFGQCEGAGDQIKPAHAQKRLVGLMDFHEPQTPASRQHGEEKPTPPHQLEHRRVLHLRLGFFPDRAPIWPAQTPTGKRNSPSPWRPGPGHGRADKTGPRQKEHSNQERGRDLNCRGLASRWMSVCRENRLQRSALLLTQPGVRPGAARPKAFLQTTTALPDQVQRAGRYR